MKVFVYGTLKRGFGNHHFLEGAEFLGEAQVPGIMYNLGAFPGVRFDEGLDIDLVSGEVFELTGYAQLERLDLLEGVPYLYTRIRMEIPQYGEVFVYQINDPPYRPVVEGGKW